MRLKHGGLPGADDDGLGRQASEFGLDPGSEGQPKEVFLRREEHKQIGTSARSLQRAGGVGRIERRQRDEVGGCHNRPVRPH